MSLEAARHLLINAGWSENRRVAIEKEISTLRHNGIAPWPGLEAIISSYGGLNILSNDGAHSLWIDPVRAVEITDMEWVNDYRAGLKINRLAPVGGYSHMLIMLGSNGRLYGGFDSEYGFIGNDIEEVVYELLCADPIRVKLNMHT